MNKNIKLCKDCKFSKGHKDFLKCHHPNNLILSRSNGEVEQRYEYCDTLRLFGLLSYIPFQPFNNCGKNGRWFQSKD